MKQFKEAKKHLKTALGENMNVGTLTPYAIAELMENYHQAKLKSFNLDIVTNWVAVKAQLPKEKQEVIMYTEKYGMHICGYNSPIWKDLKPTHWANASDIKPPCL